jgi:glycosyltransferase involved in cell wall biosynthesis
MKITYDISQIGGEKSGCGFYADQIIKELVKLDNIYEYRLETSFGDFYFDPKMYIKKPIVESKKITYGERFLDKNSAKNYWNNKDIEIFLNKPDIVHSNNFWCPTNLIKSKLIYTLYDTSFCENPEWTTELNRIGCFEGILKASIYADWIIAISNYTKNSFLKIFPHFPENRIKVIYPFSRFDGNEVNDKKPSIIKNNFVDEFFLCVGTIEPRKNLLNLILAFSQYITNTNNPKKIIIVGGDGWMMEGFKSYIEDLGISSYVILSGYLSDNELIWLYKNCYANLFPSYYEGFGLPVLEGMKFGAATIASNSSSISEITGNASILVDPNNVNGWTISITELSLNKQKRNNLKELALIQSQKFIKKTSIFQLIDLYETTLKTVKNVKN